LFQSSPDAEVGRYAASCTICNCRSLAQISREPMACVSKHILLTIGVFEKRLIFMYF
jgi:hypothetical protein